MDEDGQILQVRKIRDGTVIDHIPVGKADIVKRILKVKPTDEYYYADNTGSESRKRKGFLKLVGRYPSREEVDMISIVAPDATINYVRNWEIAPIDKYVVRRPKKINDLIKCPDNNCVTNTEQGVRTEFNVLPLPDDFAQCSYGDTLIEYGQLENHLKI